MTIYPLLETARSNETHQYPFHILRKETSQSYALHFHEFFEISFVIDGAAVEIINGKAYELRRGKLLFKLPHQIHGTVCRPGESFAKYNVMFDMDRLLETRMDAEIKRFFLFESEKETSAIQFTEEQTRRLEDLFTELVREYKEENPCKWNFIRVKLIETLITLVRFAGNERDLPQSEPSYISNKAIWEMMQYVSKAYRNPITLEHLAEKFSMSSSYISRLFRRHTGFNFSHYLQELRIRHACSLLLSSKMAIVDIASESGYESVKTFHRVFRERKSLSPSKYRRTYGSD